MKKTYEALDYVRDEYKQEAINRASGTSATHARRSGKTLRITLIAAAISVILVVSTLFGVFSLLKNPENPSVITTDSETETGGTVVPGTDPANYGSLNIVDACYINYVLDGNSYKAVLSDSDTGSADCVKASRVQESYNGLPIKSIEAAEGDWAFKAEEFYVPASVETISDDIASHMVEVQKITVDEANEKYKAEEGSLVEKQSGTLLLVGGDGIIPEGTLEIADRAFMGNQNLTKVTIPASVERIGKGIFAFCQNLSEITIDSANKYYYSEGNSIIEKATKKVVAGCKTSAIPSDGSVTTIGAEAFWGISSFESFVIPEGITTIEDFALGECQGLKSITLPGTLKNCGLGVLNININLETVIFSEGITEIPSGMFKSCYKLKNIQLASTIKRLEPAALAACNALENIIIPEGIEYIGEVAFTDCENLVSVQLPESLKYIGDMAFLACPSLTTVNIPGGLTELPDDLFSNCTSLKEISFGANIRKIGRGAFSYTVIDTIRFSGTMAEWNAIEKGEYWLGDAVIGKIICTDGEIPFSTYVK